jgi:hypothetical protein
MPAPNDVEMVRLWTREPGADIAQSAFPYDADFEIVVDVEAGHTIHSGGTEYQTGIVIRDLTDGSFIPATPDPNIPTSGHTNGDAQTPPEWPDEAHQFMYTVLATNLGAAKENHVCEAVAWLRLRTAEPDVSFSTSPLFMITRP